jgi:hypothetical protein
MQLVCNQKTLPFLNRSQSIDICMHQNNALQWASQERCNGRIAEDRGFESMQLVCNQKTLPFLNRSQSIDICTA